MDEKQLFEQNVLEKLKDNYNSFLLICREDQEITEREQRILKRYFSIKADVQALKMLVVSLTNQILNENLSIYTRMLREKYEEDAIEFL